MIHDYNVSQRNLRPDHIKVLIEKRKCDNFLQKLRKVSSHNINSLLNVKLEISSEIDKIRVILGS